MCHIHKTDSKVIYLDPGPAIPTLKMESNAKQPYNRPTGYATRKRWSDIWSTATKMPDADQVHHAIDREERK